MKKNKKNSGFTLAELMITIVVVLLVLLMVTSIYTVSQRAMRQANYKAELVQNSRVTLDLISRELRQAKKIVTELAATSDEAGSEIVFEDGHDVSEIRYIRYFFDQNKTYRQVIAYYFDTDPGIYVRYDDIDAFGPPASEVIDEKIIGEYFNSLKFYGDSDVNIDMEMKKGTAEVFTKSVINPRNL